MRFSGRMVLDPEIIAEAKRMARDALHPLDPEDFLCQPTPLAVAGREIRAGAWFPAWAKYYDRAASARRTP